MTESDSDIIRHDSASGNMSAAEERDARALQQHLGQMFPTKQTFAAERTLWDHVRENPAASLVGMSLNSREARCLLKMLEVVGWRGSARKLAEYFPHASDKLDLTDIRNILAHLGFPTRPWTGEVSDVDTRLLPALLLDPSGQMEVVAQMGEGLVRIYSGEGTERIVPLQRLKGDLYVMNAVAADNAKKDADEHIELLPFRFNRTLGVLFGITFVLNALALLSSLSIMMIYDTVIPSRNEVTLEFLILGVLIAFLFDNGLRVLKSRAIGHVSGRIEYLVATSVFGKLLGLPLEMTSTVPIGTQVSRLKEFESVREVFTGPVVSIGLEFPFMIMFLIAIYLLAGPLVMVPVTLMIVYGIVALLCVPPMRRASRKSSKLRADRTNFLLGTVGHVRTMKVVADSDYWIDSFREKSAEAAMAQFRTSRLNNIIQTFAQVAATLSGILIIAAGAVEVMNAKMTVGALVATMILVWRVLAPIQQLFFTLTRVDQLQMSLKQISQLAKMKVEVDSGNDLPLRRTFGGEILFNKVSFRYARAADMALSSLSMKIKSGEMLAIMGSSGAGKTTILRLLLNLYQPQMGMIAIDNLNIRQIGSKTLRQTIGYVPQHATLFHGSISANLRVSKPEASDQELMDICESMGLGDWIRSLPRGLDERVEQLEKHQMSQGIRQSLAIARALLRDPLILLLDEPAQALDRDLEQAFLSCINARKGTTTTIMVTHRPSHARLADKVLVMHQGLPIMLDVPEKVLTRMSGQATQVSATQVA